MTQQPQYLRYLESAKQAELAEQLRRDGFQVELEKQIGDIRFDLVASKGGRTTVYEFKSAGSSRLPREKLKRLQEQAKASGFEFRIVVVNPPPRVNIEIEDLGSEILDYVINENFPHELDNLSSHTQIDDVVDIAVSDIRVGDAEIKVKGTGTIDVTLNYGGSHDNVSGGDAFPFHFAATLATDGKLKSMEELNVDTSSFYE